MERSGSSRQRRKRWQFSARTYARGPQAQNRAMNLVCLVQSDQTGQPTVFYRGSRGSPALRGGCGLRNLIKRETRGLLRNSPLTRCAPPAPPVPAAAAR
jgi:hypothetical protein